MHPDAERSESMHPIKWQYYPGVAEHPTARAFVESQARRQKSPKTVDAYARNLEDLLRAFAGADPDRFVEASLDDIEAYIDGLSTRAPAPSSGSSPGTSASARWPRPPPS